MTLSINQLKSEMRTTKQSQARLYDSLVMTKILDGADPDTVTEAYTEYIDQLGMFDASAYDKVVGALLNESEAVLDRFTTSFENIPAYINQRNNWDTKVKEVLEMDGDSRTKQGMIDSLDRMRTNSHNGVIGLFNDVNQYATQNDMTPPYPTPYGRFDGSDVNHRADVADILTRHTTLLECTSTMVRDKFQESGKTETVTEKYRKLPFNELYAIAKTNFESKQQLEDELSESTQSDRLEL